MPESRRGAVRRRKLGVPARELSDEALRRELANMWRTREDTIRRGGPHAIATHTHRMLELEYEFISRFPHDTEPSPSRTRRGSRARDGRGSPQRRP